MARILVHSATGPENATRAALALLVARTAVEEGHEVQVFIAGDGVHLADEEQAAATNGLGTGSVAEHLAALHGAGVTDVLACPVGFVSDHLEIRWDLDVEAAQRSRELGMRFARIEMPNAAPEMVQTLAGIVRRELAAVAS